MASTMSISVVRERHTLGELANHYTRRIELLLLYRIGLIINKTHLEWGDQTVRTKYILATATRAERLVTEAWQSPA